MLIGRTTERKLRCSTERPKCSNCGQRGLVCVYGQPRRRGPGKAPRGSRAKKKGDPAQESRVEEPQARLPFASVDFDPLLPAYSYPYPPHLRSELMGPVLAPAPLDTVSSPPRTASTGSPGTTRKRRRSSAGSE
jgi:Fungal Zn(2)-Cys(6) binuclear cluster domain